jgi:hypothetical protein
MLYLNGSGASPGFVGAKSFRPCPPASAELGVVQRKVIAR